MPVPKNSKTTCNPKVIRRWVKARGGRPARRITKSGTAGSIRIELPGYRLSYPVEGILWDEFFRIFKEKDLVFCIRKRRSQAKRVFTAD